MSVGKLRRAVGAFYCRHRCSGTHPMVAQGIRDVPRGSDPGSCLGPWLHRCWTAICIGHVCLRSVMQAEGIVWEWYGGYTCPTRPGGRQTLLSKNMYQHTQLASEQRTQLNECGKGPWQTGCGSSLGVNAGAGCGEGGRYHMYRRIFGGYIATCRLVRRGRPARSLECDLVTFHRFPPMPIARGRYGLQTLGNRRERI